MGMHKDQERRSTIAISVSCAGFELTKNSKTPKFEFQPEFGSFMVEATPGHPYDDNLRSILSVERDMKQR